MARGKTRVAKDTENETIQPAERVRSPRVRRAFEESSLSVEQLLRGFRSLYPHGAVATLAHDGELASWLRNIYARGSTKPKAFKNDPEQLRRRLAELEGGVTVTAAEDLPADDGADVLERSGIPSAAESN